MQVFSMVGIIFLEWNNHRWAGDLIARGRAFGLCFKHAVRSAALEYSAVWETRTRSRKQSPDHKQ